MNKIHSAGQGLQEVDTNEVKGILQQDGNVGKQQHSGSSSQSGHHNWIWYNNHVKGEYLKKSTFKGLVGAARTT